MRKTAPIKRAHLKHGLEQCTQDERVIFVRMYGPHEAMKNDKFMFDVEMLAKYQINDVVDKMPDAKLDWAVQQVERSIQKRRNND